jgi:hypothetical protein
MKHIIFLICALFACSFTSKAQVKISSCDLDGTKWKILGGYNEVWDFHYEGSSENEYYEFKKGEMVWHRGNGKTFTYQYYISDTKPTKFDFSKVGTTTKGCYYVQYNPVANVYHYWRIMTFDKNAKEMKHEVVDPKKTESHSGYFVNYELIQEISTTDLNGTTWQIDKEYSKCTKNYIECTNRQIIKHIQNDTDCIPYDYYLSETIPTKFDSSKVGKQTKGHYLIQYDPEKKAFFSFAIQKTAKQLTLTRIKDKSGSSGGVSGAFIYVSYDMIIDRSKVNDRKPGSKKTPVKAEY